MAVLPTVELPKMMGAEQDVPAADDPEEAREKPLSVARRPLATFTAEPISAWKLLVVTEMLAA